MTPDQKEIIENIRRTAERGKSRALANSEGDMFVDLFQHILDHVGAIKRDADRPECPKCGGSGRIAAYIGRVSGTIPCDCKASK